MRARLFLLTLLLSLLAVAPAQDRPDYRRRTSTLKLVRMIDGAAFALSDGSAWEVRNEDRGRAREWEMGRKVAVYWTRHREWPYRLIIDPGTQKERVVSAEYM